MTDWQETRSVRTGGSGTVAELSSAKHGAARAAETQVVADRPADTAATFAAGAPAARKLAGILDLLRDLPGAQGIRRDALHAVADLEQSCRQSEQHLVHVVDLLLQRQARRCEGDTDARTEIELLRLHLRPPLMPIDGDLQQRLLAALDRCEDTQATQGPIAGLPLGGSEEAPAEPMHSRHEIPEAPDAQNAWMQERARDTDVVQESLGREIRETLIQNEEFGVTLDLVLSELERVRNIEDAQTIRGRLFEQVKRLHSGHFALAQKLDCADRYMRMLSTDSRNLNEELHRVRELSLTDELTSLPNRRAFMTRVEEEVARVERYGMPLSLAIIDLDRFKAVNDQHGHAAGDEVLRCYATQIFSTFRNHDLVARYGGEEFAVLLPNTDRGGAAAALRKLRECAARVRCRAEDTAFPVPTFSAGVATFKRGESAHALIDRADEALYRAKREGRDRVEFADPSAA